MDEKALESRTKEIGREIFAQAAGHEARLGSASWWDQKMMSLAMWDEAVKVQLFRFTDALPALKTDHAVNQHLREYFEQARERLPAWVRPAVRWMPRDGWMGAMLASAARSNARRLARRFIAGADLEETLRTIESLRSQGMGFTVDLLGEAVLTEREAEEYQRQYLHFVEGLARRAASWPMIPRIDSSPAGPIPKVNVSVKLSSLYSQFDPIAPANTTRQVLSRLRPILRLAKSLGVFVNIDMEQHAFKDLTLDIFESVLSEDPFKDWENVGIAIQAYLRSCGDDLRRLAEFAKKRGKPVWVRLVKGAYWDYETVIAAQQNWPVPVFTQKSETDANFERQADFLIDHRDLLRPAIASHNVRSIAHCLGRAQELALPPGCIEFQMLYGMADELKSALVARGQRVRVYTPFGQLLPGMAYLVRRLLENTSNQSFLRAGFLEHVPVEKLLMNPATLIEPNVRKVQTAVFTNEPLADFSLPENREGMGEALQRIGDQFGQTYPIFIAGKSILRDAVIESINPSHKIQIVGRCSKATPEDARAAVSAACDAFPGWRDLSVEKRAGFLVRCAQILRRRKWELSAWEVYECGKQWRESDADVAEAIDYFEYYAREMVRLSKPWSRNIPGETNEYFYEGRGVALVIAPWNFPLAILTGMTAAALVTGNTVIMKPAEQSCVIGAKLMAIFQEAGLPAGAVNHLSGVGEEIGPELVEDPRVDLIAFTGSRGVGLGINQTASKTPPGQDHVKRIITEMGGKNAIIVDEDADLDEALHGVAASAFGYAGQKCSACSRVIVVGGIYETFLERLVEVTRSLRVASAEDPSSFIGPVIDQEAFNRIRGVVERARKDFKLAYAGDVGQIENEGFFIGPHIFSDVPPQSWLAQEEIFGPVLSCLRAKDLDEALAIANGTSYALTGGLYSRSPVNIERVRRQFRVGNLYINRKITGALVDRQPFGGFKLSGIGSKAGGPDYLLQFVIPRVITENTLRRGFAPAENDMAAGE
jgi:RHH-type proline utilization regulon transcriptional repressor/proline dehydrogenase/delta 1-pyrroline-5-carboxylate dehydrogenase